MGESLLLAVDEDREALEGVETQLVQRYGRDYRVECLADLDEALGTLKARALGGEGSAPRSADHSHRPRDVVGPGL